MSTRSGVFVSLMLALPLAAATTGASTLDERVTAPHPSGAQVSSVRIGHGAEQQALSARPAWKSFLARHGGWLAEWNEDTGTPHRAFGPSFPLAGFAGEAASADRAVRDFIADNPDLFGGRGIELETRASYLAGRVWYVRYRQLVGGIPVLFSDWEFRVGTDGRLMMFGADARAIPRGLDATRRIVAPVAREAAKAGLAFNPSTDRVEGGTELAYVPVRNDDGTAGLRLVTPARVVTKRPADVQLAYVDAQNGELVWRQGLRDDAVTGTVNAPVHPTLPTDVLASRPLANESVNAVASGTVTVMTDATGGYSVTPLATPCTVTSALSGPYCTIVRVDGANAAFSKNSVANPSTQNIAWTTGNSKDAERDCFYHVNLAHDWVKAIDPAYNSSDYSLTCNVNINDGDECVAFWDEVSNSLNFYLDGATCPNTGTMPDVIWHEFGHSVAFNLYFDHGQPNGLTNGALDDGLADTFAALMGQDPIVGNGFFGPGTYLRNVQTTARWPEDATRSNHATGLIVAGAMWDLKSATDYTVASRLLQFAKYGVPDDLDAGVAMNEFFVEVLLADDDDNNLGNGTPHSAQIITAFNNHGIGTGFFMNITHAALSDQASNGPYPIVATVTYGGPIGSFSSATMYWRVNQIGFQSVSLLPTGNPDEYSADIPSVSYGIIRYYIVFVDSYGGTQTFPTGAPGKDTYTFIAGPGTTLQFDDMESNPGWTVGFAGDAATSGIWTRAVPSGTIAQPGTDHSASGTQCWVTGNLTDPDFPGLDDVDDGKTTLVTDSFDAIPPGMIKPIITYWRWFSNNLGDDPPPYTDPWRTYISGNNGSTWTLVENSPTSTNGWQRVTFFIQDYITPTHTMKMRFVAQDSLPPSLVEAALDDWYLVDFSDVLGVTPPAHATELAIGPPSPNPFRGRTQFRFTLPTSGAVDLAVFDLQGRRLKTLVRQELPAGEQTAEWDGRDAAGRLVASGPYYVRMARGDRVLSRSVVLLR